MSRGCVALDLKGNFVGHYNSLKEGALAQGVLPNCVRMACVRKWVSGGLRWMYDEDYTAFLQKARPGDLPWRMKERKGRRRKVTEESKRQMKETKEKNTVYRRELVTKWFLEYSDLHVKWLHELKDKWLERGVFTIDPSIIADYYVDKRDKEVALFASLLIATGGRCYDRVQTYRKMMGNHPWEWFKNRGFVAVEDVWHGEAKRIFAYFNELWENCFKYGSYPSIEACVKELMRICGISYVEAIEKTIANDYVHVKKTRLAHLTLVLSNAETFGRCVWDITRADVKYPITDGLKAFLRTWMPDYHKCGKDYEDYPVLFGMDSVDFYFSYLAYEDLSIFRPTECSRYSSWYNIVYSNKSHYKPYVWMRKMPKIIFSPENE